MNLIIFILAGYGLTQIICYGKIFENIRPKKGKLGKLFGCSMCIGFWAGASLSGIDCFTELFSLSSNFLDVFVFSLVSSGTSYMLDKLVGDDGIRIEKR